MLNLCITFLNQNLILEFKNEVDLNEDFQTANVDIWKASDEDVFQDPLIVVQIPACGQQTLMNQTKGKI